MVKKWYKSKTFYFNVLAIVVAIATSFGFTGEVRPEDADIVVGAVAVINIILRFTTKTKLIK